MDSLRPSARAHRSDSNLPRLLVCYPLSGGTFSGPATAKAKNFEIHRLVRTSPTKPHRFRANGSGTLLHVCRSCRNRTRHWRFESSHTDQAKSGRRISRHCTPDGGYQRGWGQACDRGTIDSTACSIGCHWEPHLNFAPATTFKPMGTHKLSARSGVVGDRTTRSKCLLVRAVRRASPFR